MLKKSNSQNLLEIFFRFPTRKFHIRELARILNISPPTVSRLVDLLAKQNLVKRRKTLVLDQVFANRENEEFIWRKRASNISNLYECRLIDFLANEFGARATIVLFGSYANGEDWEESDIDIAILNGNKVKMELHKFEKKLNRKINIHIFNLKQVSKEFKINLVNGIVLTGYLDEII